MNFASIIICHYGQINEGQGSRSEMLRNCLDSLIKNTDYPVEVIVMDNGGNPDDSEYLLEMSRKGVISAYVRYKNNRYFAFAWNQGARLASGDYLVFTCNDLIFHPSWLSKTIEGLEKYPGRKLIGTPYITPDKDRPNFNKEVLPDGYRINSMAGSNCMVMTPKVFKELGEIPHHRVGGSLWHRRMVRRGYQVIVPPTDLVSHLAFRAGINWKKTVEINNILLNGEKINYDYRIEKKKYYDGKQRAAGCEIG